MHIYLILYLVALSLPCLLLHATLISGSLNTVPDVGYETRVGAILDQTSRPGKEAKVAIELAIQDFNIKTSKPWVLYVQNSRNKPVHAAIAAKELIDVHKVKAILGAHTSEEASTIAEVIISDNKSNHDIPVFLSLATSIPQQAIDQLPFFIQPFTTQTTQMNAIAAILQSLDIRQVTLICETSSASHISHLSYALRQTGSEVTNILPLASDSSSLDEELTTLKKQNRKVFVVHTSLELGVRLIETANMVEMTGDGYLWITTNRITDLFHSINSTMISSLKGMIGVKTYFPENTPEFQNFRKRFRQKFITDYPEEEQEEPGIFALQGYNAVKLLETYLSENFYEWKPIQETIVEIVNVVGKGYNSVYWTEGLGFSERVKDDINGATTYTHSVDSLGQALWPVQPWYSNRHRRRNLAEGLDKRLRVGVPCISLFNQFVSIEIDSKKNEPVFGGFVVEVFKEMMRKMNQSYELIPFNGSYKQLVEAIHLEVFDAVAGDVTVTEKRQELAEFTQPYTESGLEMIVPVRSTLSNQPWLFLKPFTAEMWWLIATITTYNGFVIWLIEKNHNEDLRGPNIITRIGIVFWLAFTSLFTLRGDKMHSNLSRMAVVVWLFVALIITQSYTASLASMLTAQRLEPTITSIEMLRNMNATVGYCNGEFVNDYLKQVLRFDDIKIISYNSTLGYAEALNSGEIAAIFLDVPTTKLFLAQYCRSFIRTGETFKVGGYGFAFSRGFAKLADANKALLNVSESGKLKELEERYINSEKCVDEDSSPNENESLNIHSFSVLFMLTGGTSTVALAIYIIINSINEFKNYAQEHMSSLSQLYSIFIKGWQRQMRQSSSIVANVDTVVQHDVCVMNN